MALTYEYILSLKNKYTSNDSNLEKLLTVLRNSLNTETVVNWRSDKPRFLKKKEENSETILKNEINTNLNKLSPKNFNSIASTIINDFIIKNNNPVIVNFTIENLFLKAILQPVYCPYYVKFIKLLIENKIDINRIIIEKCNAFSEIVKNKEINEIENGKNINAYDEFCRVLKEKKRKAGYSQFIGELFNTKLISLEILINNIKIFIGNIQDIILDLTQKEAEDSSDDLSREKANLEDNLICICKLFETVISHTTQLIEFKENLVSIKKSEFLSKRLKFMLLNIIEKI